MRIAQEIRPAEAGRTTQHVPVAGTRYHLVISSRFIFGVLLTFTGSLPRYYPATSELSTLAVIYHETCMLDMVRGSAMARITLHKDRFATEASGQEYRGLEAGDILYFPSSPPLVTDEERTFLVTQRQIDGSLYKNISYGQPKIDSGVSSEGRGPIEAGHQISVPSRAGQLHSWHHFSSIMHQPGRSTTQVSGRSRSKVGKPSLHSRNDLLHFDSFPTRPSHGDRLLRIFVNINPDRSRIWLTSDHFEALAGRFADKVGLTEPPPARDLETSGGEARRLDGTAGDRPAPLRRLHAQDSSHHERRRRISGELPQGSLGVSRRLGLIVFTDGTSHACLSGQYMLEHTFIVRRSGLTCPDLAPISILERIAGYPLSKIA